MSLGVEIVRAIKNRKRDPDYEEVMNTTLKVYNKEDVLFRIDYFLRLEKKSSAERYINLYIEHHSKDEEISKRVITLNNM
ncbi:hypothetical protein [Polaribacter atrinae]